MVRTGGGPRRGVVEAIARSGGTLLHRIDDHGAVDAMRVSRVAAEEDRRVILRLTGDEAIVAAQAPTIVRRIPLDPAANVACKKGLVVEHADAGTLEHRQAADAAGRIRHHGVPG